MKKFNSFLEEGIDVTMWQLNRSAEFTGDEHDEFALTAAPVTVKLQRRSNLFVQAVLTFSSRGGYLSKAIGRNRGLFSNLNLCSSPASQNLDSPNPSISAVTVDKAALEPLSLFDILEVKAGCSGYDHSELPTSTSGKKRKEKKGENSQSSLFLTIRATPTPVSALRSYILRFKSRSARNDLMHGLRGILAEMQINEGVSISTLQSFDEPEEDETNVLVPLSEVHNAINREREAYDRLLLLLLQSGEDLKEKEDEMLNLRGKLENTMHESEEKDRVQANDSKLIMQLSKKLETLLMDNEDLRDQNDRLNSRLIAVECEKMNMMNN